MTVRGDDRVRIIRRRILPVHPRAYKAILFLLAAGHLAILVALFSIEPIPHASTLAPLLLLTILSTHREVLFGDETAISGSMVVVCASIIAFRGDSPLLGATLCGVFAGLHLAHVKERAGGKLLVNTAATGFGALIAAAIFSACVHGLGRTPGSIVGVPLAVLTYWLIDNLLIATALTAVTGGRFKEVATTLVTAETELVLFGLFAACLGFVITDWNAIAGMSSVAVLLLVVDAVTSPKFHRTVTRRVSVRLRIEHVLFAVTALGAAASTASHSWTALMAIVLLIPTSVVFAASLKLRRRMGSADLHLAVGLMLADLPWIVGSIAIGVIAALVGVVPVLVVVLAALAVGVPVVSWVRRRRAERAPSDEDLLSAIELALLESPPRR